MSLMRYGLLVVVVCTIGLLGARVSGLSCYCTGDDACTTPECDTPCCGCGTTDSTCICCEEPCDTCSAASGGKTGSAECVDSIVPG